MIKDLNLNKLCKLNYEAYPAKKSFQTNLIRVRSLSSGVSLLLVRFLSLLNQDLGGLCRSLVLHFTHAVLDKTIEVVQRLS